MSLRHRLTTQTGTLLAKSGSGAPKISPLPVPGPIFPQTSHTVSLVELQPLRQTASFPLGTSGKLCAFPVHPMSRSRSKMTLRRCAKYNAPSLVMPLFSDCCAASVASNIAPRR